MDASPTTIDAAQAARLLGCTPHQLRRLCRADRAPVPVIRVGDRWRFPIGHLATHLGCSPARIRQLTAQEAA